MCIKQFEGLFENGSISTQLKGPIAFFHLHSTNTFGCYFEMIFRTRPSNQLLPTFFLQMYWLASKVLKIFFPQISSVNENNELLSIFFVHILKSAKKNVFE